MLVQSQSDTYSNFINSIKSDVTKKIYEYNLRLFMEFCSVDKYEDLIASRKISYQIEDVVLVERYCDKCFNDRKEGRRKKDVDKLN